MPYLMEKGPYFSVIEDLIADPVDRAAVLQQLRAGTDLWRLAGLDSSTLSPDGRNAAFRIACLNNGWFGMKQGPPGYWTKQPGNFPTGFWSGYQGDPEQIVREAMERAIEMSFGIAHGDPVPAQPPRAWPIDLYWICQGPWFQSWVVWRKSGAGATAGHITVVMTTPAATGYPLNPRITRDPGYGARNYEYASPPPASSRTRDRGMWVVGHENNVPVFEFTTRRTRHGTKVTAAALGWSGQGTDVVCVVPAEKDGGVLSNGRPYVAP
jgi:hypothetical protein